MKTNAQRRDAETQRESEAGNRRSLRLRVSALDVQTEMLAERLMVAKNAKRALVVGLGLTGQSCVRHLVAAGYAVSGVDTRPQPPKLDELRREFPAMEMHTGGMPERPFDRPGMLVVSPGLSLKEGPVARAIAQGAQPVGDIELFARALRERLGLAPSAALPVLAITGANGKSTVTAMTGAICAAAGLATGVGGNIGTPALDLLDRKTAGVYVLELSSFQLETTWTLNPRAAVVLNITPDHMDRYTSLEEYAAAKARIFQGDGTMILNAEDERVMVMNLPGRRVIRFGLGRPASGDDYGLREQDGETWLVHGDRRIMPAAEVPLPGRHNLANALAAIALAQTVGVSDADCRAAVRNFRGQPHRTELVAEIDGVRWINDSKGTNVGATVAALAGMTAPVVLIAGGDGKGQDFAPLREPLARHGRALVLIGRDAPLIRRAVGDAVARHDASDLPDAVRIARSLAQRGDIVLLSPACASFDMFRNYEHRGDVFRDAVRALSGGRS